MTITAETAIVAIKEAMAKGPTPGPYRRSLGNIGNMIEGPAGLWEFGKRWRPLATVQSCLPDDDPEHDDEQRNREANIVFFIACNPQAIAAILADRDADKARIAELEAALAACLGTGRA